MGQAEQSLLKLTHREELARATGQIPRHVPMQMHSTGGQVELSLELLDEPNQLRDLTVGERPAIAVADQCDPDGSLIVVIAVWPNAVSTGLLVYPSVSDMRHAITQPIAVADEEVISHATVSVAQVTSPH